MEFMSHRNDCFLLAVVKLVNATDASVLSLDGQEPERFKWFDSTLTCRFESGLPAQIKKRGVNDGLCRSINNGR